MKKIIYYFHIFILLAIIFTYSDQVKLEFVNVSIKEVTRFMSDITGKTILLDENVRGNITLISSLNLSPLQAWKIYVKALRSKGYILQYYKDYVYVLNPRGKIGKVININKYKKLPLNQIITLIYPLKYVKAKSISSSIKIFLTREGRISINTDTNTIIIKDTGYNIKNLISVIKNLDTKRHLIIKRLFKLKYADAKEVAKALSNIYKSDKRFIFVADQRSNYLIVSCPYDSFKDIRIIIKNLDVKVKEKPKKFFVYYLQNADAEDVLKSINKLHLNKIFNSNNKKKTSKNYSISKDEFQISADKETNSLFVYTTEKNYKIFKSLIKQLDIERKQIMVKAYIVEVSLKKLKELGIKWHYATDKGLISFEGVSSLVDFYKSISGNYQLGIGGVSNQGENVTIGNQNLFFPQLAVFLKFLSQDSDFNLLSSPNLSTINNKEANIKVGSVVPFATGIKFDSNGNPIVTYDYKDIGLNLTITPHISRNNIIRLDIKQDIQEITDFITSNLGAMQYVVPLTSRRQISTTVKVKNGQTIVIGGLISDKKMKKYSKVPFLSDIPLIGYFFRHKSTTKEKITLFIFLTPYIVNNPDDISNIEKEHRKIERNLDKFFKKFDIDKIYKNKKSLKKTKKKIKNES